MTQPDPAPNAAPSRAVEATRYAVLRRLALVMRHQMVVHLQPIGMITEVMERRLAAVQPDLAQVHESMGKIQGFSRAAVDACLDVITWLAPEGERRVALDAGIGECVTLLRSHFSFRGFALRQEGPAALPEVPLAALRNVLPACLLALADESAAPADMVVRGWAEQGRWGVEIRVTPGEGTAGFAVDAPYRLLQWPEIEALAAAEGLAVTREGSRVGLAMAAG